MNKLKFISLILCIVMAVSLFSACAVSRVLTLTENGVSDYVIVIPENGGAPAQNAAAELSAYLEKICGVKLEIVNDSTPEVQKEILLGRTNRGDFGVDYNALGDDGYSIRTSGQKLIIAGGRRGAIYGAYGFLRDVLGCGFYSTDSEVIPSLQSVRVEKTVDITSVPRFSNRTAYWDFYYNASDADRMKLGMNPESQEWGADDFVWASVVPEMHNINNYVQGQESYWIHTYNRQPCVSSDENYNKILSTALKWIGRHDHCDAINITQNDGDGGWCTCERCTELNNLYANGSPSGSWWYFINRIATDIHAQYPNCEVVTFAYEDTRPIPSLDIVDGVTVYVAKSNGASCTVHGAGQCPESDKNNFKDLLAGWSEKVDNIFVYEYLGCPSEFNMTNPDWYAMLDNFKLFDNSSAQRVICFGTSDVAADLVALRYYLMSRLLWNPNYTPEEYDAMILDFCKGYYGAASGELIKQFVNLAVDYFSDQHPGIYYDYPITEEFAVGKREEPYYPEVTDEMRSDPNFDWLSLMKTSNIVDPTYIDGATALFEQAKALAEDETKLDRIELAQLQILYYEIYIFDTLGRAWNPWMKQMNQIIGTTKYGTASVAQRYIQMNTELWEGLRSHGVTRISEKLEVMDNPNLAQNPRYWNR